MQPIRLSPTGEPDAPALTRDQRLELAPAGRTRSYCKATLSKSRWPIPHVCENLVPGRQFSEQPHQLLIRAGNGQAVIGGVECLRKSGCCKHIVCS